MTVAQLKELATEYGLTLTETTKANIIAEILEDLYPSSLSAMALGEVTVKLGSTAITAGTDGKYEITWAEGSNSVTVKVTNGYEGEVDTTYTITVTAS